MAYFVQPNKRHQSPPKRGKVVGGAVQVPTPREPAVTRDQLIDQNIDAMARNAADRGAGVLRFVGDSEHMKVHKRNANHKPDNDIFGPPVQNPKPTPRVRTGVSDEELQKIWAEDERKAQAAQRMQQAPTLVEKMVASPINPVVPSTRTKDAVAPPRKHVELLSGTTQERNRQANEPAGFAGMGRQSAVAHRQGRSCKPPEEFLAPELKAPPRKQGRRTQFPPDTFSFQEDAQTFNK